MSKKSKSVVKPYRFSKRKPKTISPVTKSTKENILIAFGIVLVLSAYVMFALQSPIITQKLNDIKEADNSISNAIQSIQSNSASEDKSCTIPPSYLKKYINKNEDTIGYISIDGTKIDYPVVQSEDNAFYIAHDFNQEENPAGAIFMDYRCDINDFSKTRNIIIYGHRMKDGSMFKGLIDYKDLHFFLNHQIIEFDTLNASLKWKVFAVFETTTDFYYIDTEFPYHEMWLNFLEECQQRSLHPSHMSFYNDDIVLTLSTCTTEKNGRFVVMAKLIQ